MAYAIADNGTGTGLLEPKDTETILAVPGTAREVEALVETGREERVNAERPLHIAALAEGMVLSEAYTFPIHLLN